MSWSIPLKNEHLDIAKVTRDEERHELPLSAAQRL
jgi:hypothetical protein